MTASRSTKLFFFAALAAIVILTVTISRTTEGREFQAGTLDQSLGLELEPIFLPLIVNRHDHTLSPPVFGVQMYGNTTSSQFHPYLIDSGATWLRAPISWRSTEGEYAEPAVYNWTGADQALSAARPDSGELSMIVTVDDNPAWAAAYPHGPIYSDALDSFAAFVQAAVERYDGDGLQDAPGSPVVTQWEFYNEPDNTAGHGGYPHWGGAGDEYAQMLAAIYSPVKAANPEAQVLLGGLAYDWFSDTDPPGHFDRWFLDDVLTEGGGEYFDIMNFHIYPVFWYNWVDHESPGLLEKAEYLKDKLAGYGYPNKPIVITEAGWHSNIPDNPDASASSPEEQARYVVELSTQAMAAGSDVMIWWMLYDVGGIYPFDTGLVTNETAPQTKPAFDAYKVAVSELGTAHFQRILPEGETNAPEMEAYEFKDKVQGRTLYVAWLDPIDASGTKPLRVPASSATIRDIYGASYPLSDGQDGQVDGHVTVSVGGQPVYIEVDW
jgi:hypothetical protein